MYVKPVLKGLSIKWVCINICKILAIVNLQNEVHLSLINSLANFEKVYVRIKLQKLLLGYSQNQNKFVFLQRKLSPSPRNFWNAVFASKLNFLFTFDYKIQCFFPCLIRTYFVSLILYLLEILWFFFFIFLCVKAVDIEWNKQF